MNTHAHMSLGCSPIMQLKPTSIVCLLHTYVMSAQLRLYDYTGSYESSLLVYAINRPKSWLKESIILQT